MKPITRSFAVVLLSTGLSISGTSMFPGFGSSSSPLLGGTSDTSATVDGRSGCCKDAQ